MCCSSAGDVSLFDQQSDSDAWPVGSFYETIRDSRNTSACRMRESFEQMFQAWPDGDAKIGIRSRFRSAREPDHYGAVLELLTFESLRRSGFKCSVEGQHKDDSTVDFIVPATEKNSGTAIEAKAICRNPAEISDDRILHRFIEEAWNRIDSPLFSLEIDGFLRATSDTPPLRSFSSFIQKRFEDCPEDSFEWVHESTGWKITGTFHRVEDEGWTPSRGIFSISSGCYLDNSVERAKNRVNDAINQHTTIDPSNLVVSLGSSSVRHALDEDCFIMSLVGPPSYCFEKKTTRFVHSGIWRDRGAIRKNSPGAIIYFGGLWRDLGRIMPTLWVRPDLWPDGLLSGWIFNRASWDIDTGECIEQTGDDSLTSIDPVH